MPNTLAVMLAWSLLATCLYCCLRNHGFPDILDDHVGTRNWTQSWLAAPYLVFRIALAGAPAFLFAHVAGLQTRLPNRHIAARIIRAGLLLVGLTLFGVVIAEHILRQAGLRDRGLLGFALGASFLHVPYRVFCAALLAKLLPL